MHDCIVDIDDPLRQYRVWNSNRDRFAERTAVEYDRLAAADQHRVIFAKRDLTAARRNNDAAGLIHEEREIVVAVSDHLTRTYYSGGRKPARHQLQSRQGTRGHSRVKRSVVRGLDLSPQHGVAGMCPPRGKWPGFPQIGCPESHICGKPSDSVP